MRKRITALFLLLLTILLSACGGQNENTIVSSLISKEEAQKSRLEEMVEETFEGSMPAFIAAFSKSKKLTRQEVDQLKALIDSFEEE